MCDITLYVKSTCHTYLTMLDIKYTVQHLEVTSFQYHTFLWDICLLHMSDIKYTVHHLEVASLTCATLHFLM